MKASSLLAVAVALAVGGGVGWWIRRERAADRGRGDVVADGERDTGSGSGDAPARAGDGPGGSGDGTGPDEGGETPKPVGPKPFPAPNNPKDGDRVLIVTPADLATPDGPAKGPPKVLVVGYEVALREVDWTDIGRTAAEMPALGAALAKGLAETGAMPPDVAGRFGTAVGLLADAALLYRDRLGADRFPHAYATWSHPPFAANVLASALDAAGKPLGDERTARVAELARVYTEKERATASDASAFALARFLEEAAIRGEFWTAAAATLDDAQRAHLWPAGAKGRIQLDAFSVGPAWSPVAQPLAFDAREGLAARLSETLTGALGIPEDRAPVVREAMEELVSTLPAGLLDAPTDPVALRGFLPIATTTEVARRWLVALERIVRLGRLDEATTARVRGAKPVLFPVRAPPAPDK